MHKLKFTQLLKYDSIVKGENFQTKQNLEKLYIRTDKLDEELMTQKTKEEITCIGYIEG